MLNMIDNDRITQGADFLDIDHNFITIAQPTRRRAAQAYSSGSSGADNVTRFECHEPGDIFDQLRCAEDQLSGIGMLKRFAVDAQANVERVRIGYFILGNNVWPYRREGVEALTQSPLRGGKLDVTRAYVIQNRITEDMLSPVLARDVAAAFTDHNREFRLVIGLLRVDRDLDRCARSNYCRR